MDSVLATIKKEVEVAMNKMDIILTNIEYVKEGKYNFLRIELDKVNGIDLDTIVEATNVINPILDELDLIEDNYILDVISKERG
ncbi:MAG: ribosome maturation factor RimP [Bacilli bacterium]|nr:ribosome maturation factor RimP [Bacilli bacterium]